MHRFILASLIMIGALVVWISARDLTFADEPGSHGQVAVQDFGDGILLLSIDRTSGIEGRRGSTTLTDAKLVSIGERYFVRGNTYIAPDNVEQQWYSGVEVAVAWEDVIGFYLFSEEQMKKYIAMRQAEEE